VSSIQDLITRYDSSRMDRVIEGMPAQIETALAEALPLLPGGPFQRVIIAGMGGSALPAEVLLDAFWDRLRVPLEACRTYELPRWTTGRSLIVSSSFSGNTEETISALGEVGRDGNVVVITAGGRLAQMAAERGYPLLRIPAEREPPGFQPRSATGYFVTFLARVLEAAGALEGSLAELERLPAFLRSLQVRPAAEETGVWLRERIPVVYTDQAYVQSVARITKIKFNENSKRPAFFNALPEANHNETIGFTRDLGRFGILYLHDPASHPRVRRRYQVMERVFAEQGISHVSLREWVMPGETRLQKIFGALAFADWCSYTLALLDGVDPTPVPLVERFKRALNE
jgi:glucose/mannose-6-phosphate isomerase